MTDRPYKKEYAISYTDPEGTITGEPLDLDTLPGFLEIQANIKEAILEIKERLDIMEKMLVNVSRYVENAPVWTTRDEYSKYLKEVK